MTIENRTSYLRYLFGLTLSPLSGGYTNRYQRDFISWYMYRTNVRYEHFGDMDAGGSFWIHHNLCEVTGVRFELFACQSVNCNLDMNAEAETSGQTLEFRRMEPYAEVVDYIQNRSEAGAGR